jgi:TetR/AcrR family transcriptional regulator
MQYEESTKPIRWARRKESRPGELLEAALASFVEYGFAATRLEDVAAKAGVSKGTLYLYFKNKEELFKAVLKESVLPLIEKFADEAKTLTLSNDDLVRFFFKQWWVRFGSTKLSGICKLMTAESGNFPELAVFFQQEVIEKNNQLLLNIVRKGVAEGDYQPKNYELAVHLWMAPMVLHTIWSNSIGKCVSGISTFTIPDEEYIAMHSEFVLATLKTKT